MPVANRAGQTNGKRRKVQSRNKVQIFSARLCKRSTAEFLSTGESSLRLYFRSGAHTHLALPAASAVSSQVELPTLRIWCCCCYYNKEKNKLPSMLPVLLLPAPPVECVHLCAVRSFHGGILITYQNQVLSHTKTGRVILLQPTSAPNNSIFLV